MKKTHCSYQTLKLLVGAIVFVKTDFLHWFVENMLPRFQGTYVLITHNGDYSSPDIQTDKAFMNNPPAVSPALLQEYEGGRLLALHAQNSWWRGYTYSQLQ